MTFFVDEERFRTSKTRSLIFVLPLRDHICVSDDSALEFMILRLTKHGAVLSLTTYAMIACLFLSAACGRKHNRIARAPQSPSPASAPSRPPHKVQPPVSVAVGYSEQGLASWYGNPYHGRPAADGEIYNMDTLVAAHRVMPFNTWLRVTNLSNNKEVDVRVIDRGPFVGGRIIDLSRAAARQIDLIGPGVATVRLQVVAAPADVPSNDFYAVQVGAFTLQSNAERVRSSYAQRFGAAQIELKQGRVPLWRVLVGKERSIQAAQQLANTLSQENKDVFIVRLDETVVPPAMRPPMSILNTPAPVASPVVASPVVAPPVVASPATSHPLDRLPPPQPE